MPRDGQEPQFSHYPGLCRVVQFYKSVLLFSRAIIIMLLGLVYPMLCLYDVLTMKYLFYVLASLKDGHTRVRIQVSVSTKRN